MEFVTTDGKFSEDDVASLRSELLQSGLDTWQAAELISSFLSARGYGIATGEVCSVATVIDGSHESLQTMHRELERVALVM